MVRIDEIADGVLIAVKAVPGASRDEIAGSLGDRLKVRVSAAAEGGKANKAVCALIARALGVTTNQVSVTSGVSSPEKVVRIDGVNAAAVRERLGV